MPGPWIDSGRVGRRAPLLWIVPSVLTALVVNLPLVYIFLRAGEQGWTEYWRIVWNPQTLLLLRRSLLLAFCAVTLAITIALPAAWLVVRTDLPARRFWAVLAALPLVFPSYVAAFSLMAFFGPRGYLQSGLERLHLTGLPALDAGFFAALASLGLFTYPYLFLLLVSALQELDPALEESARSLGAGPWRTFATVVVPQLRSPLLAGSLLVALYTLSDFGAVSIARYNTFTLSIYNAYRGLFDRTNAAALATLLVGVTFVLVVLEARLGRQDKPHRQRPPRLARPVPLGPWKVPGLLAMGLLAAVTVGVPTGTVGYWGLRALWSGNELGAVGAGLWGSLSVSLLAALLAVLLSIPICAWSVWHQGRWSRWTERLTYSGFALPGLVIALSMVFFSVRYARPLYQTLPLLALAYVVRFLPEASASTRSAMAALSPAFQESARSLGRTPTETLFTLTLPMILPGLLAGGSLVFLTSMKELPATLLLRPIGFETLATEIWSSASEAIYSRAAAPALALVAATAPPLYWLLIRPVLKDSPVTDTHPGDSP